jgi:hypothetical protein
LGWINRKERKDHAENREETLKHRAKRWLPLFLAENSFKDPVNVS